MDLIDSFYLSRSPRTQPNLVVETSLFQVREAILQSFHWPNRPAENVAR